MTREQAIEHAKSVRNKTKDASMICLDGEVIDAILSNPWHKTSEEQAKESFNKFYDRGLELGKSIAKQQFKEYLEKKKEENSYFNIQMNMIRQNTIDEIINELFPVSEQDNTDREE